METSTTTRGIESAKDAPISIFGEVYLLSTHLGLALKTLNILAIKLAHHNNRKLAATGNGFYVRKYSLLLYKEKFYIT